ncbi:MAG: PilZ domain-containing protein [Rhodospirillales bacterium]|nr:PilZ domain-containing protein [Rhodospirillales bacterium]
MMVQKGAEQRSSKRNSLSLSAQLTSDKRTQNVVIEDISIGGAKLRPSGTSPTLNSDTILSISTFGELQGCVVWNRKNSLGIRFNENEEKMGTLLYSIASYGAGAIA